MSCSMRCLPTTSNDGGSQGIEVVVFSSFKVVNSDGANGGTQCGGVSEGTHKSGRKTGKSIVGDFLNCGGATLRLTP